MSQYRYRASLAFTLVEFLVILVMIGILASLVISAVNGGRLKSRDARRVADIKQMQTALELYFSDEQLYPQTWVANQPLVSVDNHMFMDKRPSNPKPWDEGACGGRGGDYVYTALGNPATNYTISYCLGKNVDAVAAGQQTVSSLNVTGLGCNCLNMCADQEDGCGRLCTGALCSWGPVGDLQASYSVNSPQVEMAFNYQTGYPYIAYNGSVTSLAQISGFDGTGWDRLPKNSPGISMGNANYLSIAVHPLTGEPYLAMSDYGDHYKRLYVKRYHNGVWEEIATGPQSKDRVSYVDMAFNLNTNMPYVVYRDFSNNFYGALAVYNGTGFNTFENYSNSVPVESNRIAFKPDDQMPYIAYSYNGGLNTKIKMLKFDGANFTTVPSGSQGFADGTSVSFEFKFSPLNNLPYIAYVKNATPNQLLVTFFDGNQWHSLPENSDGITPNGAMASPGAMSLAINPVTGRPYVAYFDVLDSTLHVMMYNGQAWQEIGGGSFGSSFNRKVVLAFNPLDNRPYVAFTNAAITEGVTVVTFEP
jgi:type II secretory pathway pseudopilin PulG